tara:strand:+ start:260 stop:634 length:375 start_codon:yes stop_codon:yes gene_type:complete
MKALSRRPDRVGEMVRMAISQVILHGLRDPRIGLATITEVKMSPDLKLARVFVSVLGNSEQQKVTVQQLNYARAHIRHEISSLLKLRRVPELMFEYDSSADYGTRIEELIQQTRKKQTIDEDME